MLLEEEVFVTGKFNVFRLTEDKFVVSWPSLCVMIPSEFRYDSLEFCNASYKLLVATVCSLLKTLDQAFSNANITLLKHFWV